MCASLWKPCANGSWSPTRSFPRRVVLELVDEPCELFLVKPEINAHNNRLPVPGPVQRVRTAPPLVSEPPVRPGMIQGPVEKSRSEWLMLKTWTARLLDTLRPCPRPSGTRRRANHARGR